MTKTGTSHERSLSELIGERIAELGDWRADVLRRVHQLINKADPEIIEEWTWRGTSGARSAFIKAAKPPVMLTWASKLTCSCRPDGTINADAWRR